MGPARDKAGIRFPVPGGREEQSPVLPRELTPLVAEGAVMEPLYVSRHWRTSAKLHGECSGITLPSRDDARASLRMEQPIMDEVRSYVSYECHDLRIIRADSEGRLQVLTCKRAEPNTERTNGLETSPINGFWWSIGGRREIPAPGSPLEGKFDLIDSILLKANREAGIVPKDVIGIYDLGIGRTEFPKRMVYVSSAAGDDGAARETRREVTMAFPQNTINRNIVVEISGDAIPADQSVEHLTWLTETDYADPPVRARFCNYEQAFLDALFHGWHAAQIAGRRLE